MHQELPQDRLAYIAPAYDGHTYTLRSSDTSIVAPSVSELHPDSRLDQTWHFNLVGGSRTGTAWIIVSAPGIAADSMRVVVGRGVAHVSHRVTTQFDGSHVDSVAVQLVDQNGEPRTAAEEVVFDLSSSNASVAVTDPVSLTIPAARGSAIAGLHFQWSGTTFIRAVDPRTLPYAYAPASSDLITYGTGALPDRRSKSADSSSTGRRLPEGH
jgi:hypothetical protein